MDLLYLDLGDFLLIAEVVTGIRAEVLGGLLVDLASHTISERDFVEWVTQRLKPSPSG